MYRVGTQGLENVCGLWEHHTKEILLMLKLKLLGTLQGWGIYWKLTLWMVSGIRWLFVISRSLFVFEELFETRCGCMEIVVYI